MSQSHAHALVADPWFPGLKQHIIRVSGLAYYENKDHDLASHLQTRLAALELADCATYFNLLKDSVQGEAELDLLIAELTIGETYFFRHPEQFDALREVVLPDLIARNAERRRLHIWSAGCATGAEAYSIAMLLARHFAAPLTGWDVTILGTDVNRTFLRQAQKAEFNEWALRSMAVELREACFLREGKLWTVRPEFRRGVSFQYHNLAQHPFPSLVNNIAALDLIFCRNVMIYFDSHVVQKIVTQMHASLLDGGWLLVGHAEPNVETFRAFRTLNGPSTVLYQKNAQPSPVSTWSADSLQKFFEPPQNTTSSSPPIPPVAPLAPQPATEQGRRAAKKPAAPRAPFSASLGEVRTKLDQGDWQAAARGCERLLIREKLSPRLHFYHALALEQLGQHGPAEQSLRRTIYLDRGFVLAHYYLGLLLEKTGARAEARRSLRNVLDLIRPMADDGVVADADGLLIHDLKRITQTQLEVLSGA